MGLSVYIVYHMSKWVAIKRSNKRSIRSYLIIAVLLWLHARNSIPNLSVACSNHAGITSKIKWLEKESQTTFCFKLFLSPTCPLFFLSTPYPYFEHKQRSTLRFPASPSLSYHCPTPAYAILICIFSSRVISPSPELINS